MVLTLPRLVGFEQCRASCCGATGSVRAGVGVFRLLLLCYGSVCADAGVSRLWPVPTLVALHQIEVYPGIGLAGWLCWSRMLGSSLARHYAGIGWLAGLAGLAGWLAGCWCTSVTPCVVVAWCGGGVLLGCWLNSGHVRWLGFEGGLCPGRGCCSHPTVHSPETDAHEVRGKRAHLM